MKLPRFVSFVKRRPWIAAKRSSLPCLNINPSTDQFSSPLSLSTFHHHHHHLEEVEVGHNPSVQLHSSHHHRHLLLEEVGLDLNLSIGLSSPHHNEEVEVATHSPSMGLPSPHHPPPPDREHDDGVGLVRRSAEQEEMEIVGVEELKRAFHRFDVDGDGRISAEELRSVLCSLGDQTTSDEASLLVRNLDKDGDGFIGLQDFFLINLNTIPTIATHHHVRNHSDLDDNDDNDDGEHEDEEMMSVFRTFDIDGNGYIDDEELHRVLSCLVIGDGNSNSKHDECSVARCREMIRQVDRNGDGVVDFDEFKEMMAISY